MTLLAVSTWLLRFWWNTPWFTLSHDLSKTWLLGCICEPRGGSQKIGGVKFLFSGVWNTAWFTENWRSQVIILRCVNQAVVLRSSEWSSFCSSHFIQYRAVNHGVFHMNPSSQVWNWSRRPFFRLMAVPVSILITWDVICECPQEGRGCSRHFLRGDGWLQIDRSGDPETLQSETYRVGWGFSTDWSWKQRFTL